MWLLSYVLADKEESQHAMKKHLEKELALYKNVVSLYYCYTLRLRLAFLLAITSPLYVPVFLHIQNIFNVCHCA